MLAREPTGLEHITLLMDSAAAAYREGDVLHARDIYREVVTADSTLAAGWFGLFMTERVMGDTIAANRAFLNARRLAEPTAANPGR